MDGNDDLDQHSRIPTLDDLRNFLQKVIEQAGAMDN